MKHFWGWKWRTVSLCHIDQEPMDLPNTTNTHTGQHICLYFYETFIFLSRVKGRYLATCDMYILKDQVNELHTTV